METSVFTGWIYDPLLPHAEQAKVARTLILRANTAAKKNGWIDAVKIADYLCYDFLCSIVSEGSRTSLVKDRATTNLIMVKRRA